VLLAGLSSRLLAQDPFEIHIYEYEPLNWREYSLEAHLNISPQGSAVREGTLLPSQNQTHLTLEPTFDNDAVEEISRIEHYRRYLGVHRRALPLICQLRRECDRMRIKLAFLGDTWSEGAWSRDI